MGDLGCRRRDEMLKGKQAELRRWMRTRKGRGSPNSTAQVDLAILVCEYTVITITDVGLDMLCHANPSTKKWHCMVKREGRKEGEARFNATGGPVSRDLVNL